MTEHVNKVELVGFYGSDETHALSAWTSTSRELTAEKKGRMDKLLNTLAKEGHHSVFEKSSLHFLLTLEIVSHYQLLKHRIGVSINAESARYKELKDDKFYVPVDWDEQDQKEYIEYVENALKVYHRKLAELKAKGVPAKRAKESARFYLPCGNQLTMDCMFNMRSFIHFQGLRNEDTAQLEIKNVAKEMLIQVADTNQFTLSLNAFGWTKDKIYVQESYERYNDVRQRINR